MPRPPPQRASDAPSLSEVREAAARRSLMRFVPWATVGYSQPTHLAELVVSLERAFTARGVRLVIHAPPQHTKTETILHGIAWGLWRDPRLRVSYSSYEAGITRRKSAGALRIARGVVALERDAVTDWVTTSGGGLLARSVREGLTGSPVDVAIIDDPIKDRAQAESATYREHLREWFQSSLLTRLPPSSSVVVCATRWHPDDLSGWLVREHGYSYLRLPAVDEAGAVLWPGRWSPESMAAQRQAVGEYTWASLYQGEPRPRGGSVFGDVATYRELPASGLRWGIGVDLAYSARTSADYSVAVVVALDGRGTCHVVDVVRVQTQAPAFLSRLAALQARHPTARLRWYASGTELGAAAFMRSSLPQLEARAPRGDKFTRAQPVAAAWNAGRVLVPEDSDANPWLSAFVAELAGFTGVSDDHDDQVDALAAAFDVAAESAGPRLVTGMDVHRPTAVM